MSIRLDEELETFIDLIVADGVVTDQERRVLLKKAAALGADPDEVEVVLEAKLHQTVASEASRPRRSSNKCGSCGALVDYTRLTCAYCGGAQGQLDSPAKELQAIKELTKTAQRIATEKSDDDDDDQRDKRLNEFWLNCFTPQCAEAVYLLFQQVIVGAGRGEIEDKLHCLERAHNLYTHALATSSNPSGEGTLLAMKASLERTEASVKKKATMRILKWIGAAALVVGIYGGVPWLLGAFDPAPPFSEEEELACKNLEKSSWDHSLGDAGLSDAVRLSACLPICEAGEEWACKMIQQLE
jgi:hypothetical protein